MKELRLGLVLLALAVSACDNKLPPTKAPGAGQSPYVTSDAVVNLETVGD